MSREPKRHGDRRIPVFCRVAPTLSLCALLALTACGDGESSPPAASSGRAAPSSPSTADPTITTPEPTASSLGVAPEGSEAARIVVDPNWQPDPQATSIPLLSTEVGCASGLPPEGRAVSMSVTENAATIYVSVFIERPEGDASCPTNPTEALSIPLDEPLGNREVVDGVSGEVLLDQAGVITTGVPQPATLSITMTGPIVYIEGAVTVLEVSDNDGALVAPRQFQMQGQQVSVPNADPDFEQHIDNVTIQPGTWQVEIWMLVCSIDTPCLPPDDDALNELIDTGRAELGPPCTRTVAFEPGQDVRIDATWTTEGCASIN